MIDGPEGTHEVTQKTDRSSCERMPREPSDALPGLQPGVVVGWLASVLRLDFVGIAEHNAARATAPRV